MQHNPTMRHQNRRKPGSAAHRKIFLMMQLITEQFFLRTSHLAKAMYKHVMLFLWKKPPTKPWLDLDWDTGFLLKNAANCFRCDTFVLPLMSEGWVPNSEDCQLLLQPMKSTGEHFTWFQEVLEEHPSGHPLNVQDQIHPQHRPMEIFTGF